MNRIKIYILSLLSLLLLFNCTKEESTIPEKDRLYIHVATTSFAADGVPSTKAVNTGFLTTFEIGDSIGVTGIDANGNITSSGDGKLNNGCVNPTTAYYLSSTSSPKTLKDISYAFFTADKQQILTNGSRYTGMLVRPVYSPNEY